MKSMTGYAWQESVTEIRTVSVEIKSYNSRFLDLSVNIPFWLGRLESRIREYASSNISRGKVEVNIRVREKNSNIQVLADTEAARAYSQAIIEIADAIGHTEQIPLSLVISQEGVLRAEKNQDIDEYWQSIEPVLVAAFKDFDLARITEGRALQQDIELMLRRIIATADTVAERVPEMEETFKENVRSRFREMLGNQVDEQRVLQETAALLMKYTMNEELVRLRSHITSLEAEMSGNPAPGRKIDFICQEMNREINTIGSKNQLIEVGQAVISAKDALENIREQMRNIE